MRRFDILNIFAMAGLLALVGCWQGPGPAVEPPPVAVSVAPEATTLTTGGSCGFAGRIDGLPAPEVAWKVLEAGGGTVDGTGHYRAPDKPGVYTVQAGFKVRGGRTATATVTVVAPPVAEIAAPARALPGATGLTARIQPVAGSRYAWTLTGGQLTAGSDTAAVTFEAGTGPKLVLVCTVTNAAGDTFRSSVEIPVVAPVTLSIRPETVTLTAGRAMKFGYVIKGGISLDVTWSLMEPGAGSLDNAGNYTAPAVPGLYSVRVTSVDEPERIATARIQVVAKPPEDLFTPASCQPGAAGLRAMMPEVPGVTYAWTLEGGTITSGADGPVMVFTAGNGPDLTVRCKATNPAGDFFTAERTLTVGP